MPAHDSAAIALAKRYVCNGYGQCYYNAWDTWARWVVLGVIVIVAAAVLMTCSCFNARRRRRRGLTPYYGTGWAAPHGGVAPPPENYPGRGYNQGWGQPAPPYPGPGNEQYGGYYGQQTGVEMQPPASAYQPPANRGYPDGVEPVYAPPPHSPPPKKGDVIR